MNLAVVSNINIDPIKNYLKKYCDLISEIKIGDFNNFIFDLIAENSFLYGENIDSIFLFIDYDEFFKNTFYNMPNFKKAKILFDDVLNALNLFLEKNPKKVIFINNLSFTKDFFNTYIDSNSIKSFGQIENKLNLILRNFKLRHNNIYIFDFKRIIEKNGLKNLIDEKFWYLGRIKYNENTYVEISKNFNNLFNSLNGNIKKVLILDLDNTLWGGILGEDGLYGINLSEEGKGKIFRDFQKNIKSLKKIGILLCICSKNNFNDVDELFKNNKMMILKKNDFIVKKINWNNKVENILGISKELNLGLNSFVFIDDNPVERNIVKTQLNEVAVPEFPENIECLNSWFFEEVVYKYFMKISLTTEDLKKNNQYKNNFKRAELSKKFDYKTYLESLNIKLNILKNNKEIIDRMCQLTQKTNQFNLSVKRYSIVDFNAFFNNNDYNIYAGEYIDNFANEGITALAITKKINDVLLIDTFLLSCRIIGRNIEYKFLNGIIEDNKKIKFIEFDFKKTDKNTQTVKFMEKIGLSKVKENKYFAERKMLLKKLGEIICQK